MKNRYENFKIFSPKDAVKEMKILLQKNGFILFNGVIGSNSFYFRPIKNPKIKIRVSDHVSKFVPDVNINIVFTHNTILPHINEEIRKLKKLAV
jgi:hypothetical protein